MSSTFGFDEDDFEDDFADEFEEHEDTELEDEEVEPVRETKSKKSSSKRSSKRSSKSKTQQAELKERERSSHEAASSKMSIVKKVVISISAVVLFAGGVGLAYSGGYSSGAANAKPEIKQVESITKQSTILENLETVKDSQLAAQSKEIESIRSKVSTNDELTDSEKLMLAKLADDSKATATIDDFLSHIMSLSPTADDKVVNVTRDEILKLMTKESGVSAAFDILKGPSVSKQTGHVGKRGSMSNVFPVKFNDDVTTYLVITPFVTDTEVVNQIAVVSLKGELINSYKYIGIVDSVNAEDLVSAFGEK